MGEAGIDITPDYPLEPLSYTNTLLGPNRCGTMKVASILWGSHAGHGRSWQVLPGFACRTVVEGLCVTPTSFQTLSASCRCE